MTRPRKNTNSKLFTQTQTYYMTPNVQTETTAHYSALMVQKSGLKHGSSIHPNWDQASLNNTNTTPLFFWHGVHQNVRFTKFSRVADNQLIRPNTLTSRQTAKGQLSSGGPLCTVISSYFGHRVAALHGHLASASIKYDRDYYDTWCYVKMFQFSTS